MDELVAPADTAPRAMRGKIEDAIVAGLNAKATIGEMALRVLAAMRDPTEGMKGYAQHRLPGISRSQAHDVWMTMIDEATYGDRSVYGNNKR